jgi:hypothetical protein
MYILFQGIKWAYQIFYLSDKYVLGCEQNCLQRNWFDSDVSKHKGKIKEEKQTV